MLGGVCLVDGGGRVGVCPSMPKPADSLKEGLDSAGGSGKSSVGYWASCVLEGKIRSVSRRRYGSLMPIAAARGVFSHTCKVYRDWRCFLLAVHLGPLMPILGRKSEWCSAIFVSHVEIDAGSLE